MTGLSAATLEYVLLALVVTYPIVSFLADRLPGRWGKALGLLMKALPFVEVQIRKDLTKAKAPPLPPAPPAA